MVESQASHLMAEPCCTDEPVFQKTPLVRDKLYVYSSQEAHFRHIHRRHTLFCYAIELL